MSKRFSIRKIIVREIGSFDRTATIGLLLLFCTFIIGIVTRPAASITDGPLSVFPLCDSYISWLCIPTAYVAIPLGPLGWLIINLTTFISVAVLFVLGILLVRK